MEELPVLLEAPKKYFTNDFRYFLNPVSLDLKTKMPPLLEDESVIAYVHSGYGQVVVNGSSFKLCPGAFCQFHSYHAFTLQPDFLNPLRISFLIDDYTLMSYWGFSDTNREQEIQDIFYLPPVIYPDRETQNRILHILDNISEECAMQKLHNLLIRTTLSARLRNLYMYLCKNSLAKTPSFTPTKIWNLIIFLTVYCRQKLTIDSMAEQFEISASSVNRQLRQITGLNFSQFLSRARVNYAAGAIMVDRLSLQSIAVNSGFASESTFFRQFLRHRGCTPKEYREKIADEKFQNPNHFITDKVYEILYYILCHFKEDISLKKMCRELYLTEQHVTLVLKQKYNATYHEIVTLYRLRYAQALLLVSPLNLEDIAYYSGFPSVHTLIRQFEMNYNMSPTAYRKKYKENLS